ncbi:MAG TPA: substrate-binding domain-containing protein [Acetobacteraceae bacterium]|jgi:simple sugar transport system substrate-binding protein|nr:substrate-binding domain-containing protein [Acetobacteraceae bacterium]
MLPFDRRGFLRGSAAGAAAGFLGASARQARAAATPPWAAWVRSYMKKPIKLAMTCYNTTNPYFTPTKIGAQDAGAQVDVEVQWTGVPDGNTVAQIAQFRQLVATGFQGIAVIPLEADAWIAPIKHAMEQGVVVVCANSDSPKSGRELFFGQDLVGAAVVQGQMLAKLAGGKGTVAMTNCAPGLLALDQRIEGAKKGVTAGGLEVVGVFNTNPSDMASERATIRDIAQSHPDLTAMMPLCGPDTAAAGLVKQEMKAHWPIVGTDLMYQTLEMIRDGVVDGTVGQEPYLQGYLPIMYLYQRIALNGPRLDLPGGNYFMANEIVTKENVAEYLEREKRFRG